MDRVIVLMSTYNGERYIRPQIESILRQKDVKVEILVRDDGSSDSTIEILDEYKKNNLLNWYSGRNKKPAKSFMELIQKSPDAPFYAFSDQDDIWFPDKLKTAIRILKEQDDDCPILYYGATIAVDSSLNRIKHKPLQYFFNSFNQCIVSSNATGCTMCFNRKLRDIINMYKPNYQVMHDSWIHKVCLALGGVVYYDKIPYIYYRQHKDNVIGITNSIMKKWRRRIQMIKEDPNSRSKGIEEIYNGYGDMLSEENRRLCQMVINYKKSFWDKLNLLFSRDIYSSSLRIDLFYRFAVLLGLF